jgi:hypothetical protein
MEKGERGLHKAVDAGLLTIVVLFSAFSIFRRRAPSSSFSGHWVTNADRRNRQR